MAKKKGTMAKAGQKLRDMYNRGKKHIYLFYTREVNGKRIPNYKKLAITGALVSAAGLGAYYLKKHKKHGHVLVKKK